MAPTIVFGSSEYDACIDRRATSRIEGLSPGLAVRTCMTRRTGGTAIKTHHLTNTTLDPDAGP